MSPEFNFVVRADLPSAAAANRLRNRILTLTGVSGANLINLDEPHAFSVAGQEHSSMVHIPTEREIKMIDLALKVNESAGANLPDEAILYDLVPSYFKDQSAEIRRKYFDWEAIILEVADPYQKSMITRTLNMLRMNEITTVGQVRNLEYERLIGEKGMGYQAISFLQFAFRQDPQASK